METCEEAMFYYTVCGIKKLDGDGNGTQCENLCWLIRQLTLIKTNLIDKYDWLIKLIALR
jgi:hypothetical protein